jgi:glycerol-3-phosphate O-acyltransferase
VLAERYGRINMQIGEILTVDDIKADIAKGQSGSNRPPAFVPKRALVTRLGHQITYEINRATMVTGGSLVAQALLSQAGRGMSRSELVRRAEVLLATLERQRARMQRGLRTTDGGLSPRALEDAIALFSSAKWLQIEAGESGEEPVYVVPDEGRVSLDLSKNVIVHFFVPFGMIAASLFREGATAAVSVRTLRDRVQHLSRLFKYEFMFRADATYEQIFDETLHALAEEGTVSLAESDTGGEEVKLGSADDAAVRVELYSASIMGFLEAYRIAARTLPTLIKGGATQKELVKRALSTGKRMFLSGEVGRREAIQRPLFENAFQSFLDQGVLAKADGKLVLAESFGTIDTVRAFERRIAGYIARTEA